ncbi:hypothetical protein [Mesorhizobium sp.]|uniref:hypothetical protein n=1 Tax=Mesorhizobium sp. TaxID=1871066 RepID=UPI003BA8A3E3
MNARFLCLSCVQPIEDGEPTYPDVSGTLCQVCAPTYSMLLDENEACGFVNLDDESPMSAEQRRALYDAHISAGDKPNDSMATVD